MEREEGRELAGRVRCPVLVIHGEEDGHSSVTRGIALAEHTGGRLVLLGGSFHAPHVRDPVRVNLLLRDFIKPAPPPRRWVRGKSRRKRALYISSPFGLGHAQRDVAIATELRKLHPDLEIDWLAQHPVTRVLEAAGERIHPASKLLANESAHIERESAEHDLRAGLLPAREPRAEAGRLRLADRLRRLAAHAPQPTARSVGVRPLPRRKYH